MKCGKDFLATCGAIIGATGLHPRERLTFIVIALLGDNQEYVSRKEICENTGIAPKHITEVLSSLEEKKLIELHVGAKTSTDMPQCFEQETDNGSLDEQETNNRSLDDEKRPIIGRNPHNRSLDDEKIPIIGQNPHNGSILSEEKNKTDSLPLIPPSSSLSNSLINNPLIFPHSHVACACEDSFDEFWANYPARRRFQKAKCKELYFKFVEKGTEAEDINAGLMRHLVEWNKSKTENTYIPHSTTWLNGKRWELELPFGDFGNEKPTVNQYTKEEESFLNVWGKKPRNKSEIEAFKEVFKRACDEVGDADVVTKSADIFLKAMIADEGSNRFQKRPQNWLDDCDYRQYLEQARRVTRSKQVAPRVVRQDGLPI